MTVKELIYELLDYDQSMTVVDFNAEDEIKLKQIFLSGEGKDVLQIY